MSTLKRVKELRQEMRTLFANPAWVKEYYTSSIRGRQRIRFSLAKKHNVPLQIPSELILEINPVINPKNESE